MALLPVWSHIFCNGETIRAVVSGSDVTAIPTGIEPANMTYLRILYTNIQTLDLRLLLPYTALGFLKVESSPVSRVVSAHLPALEHLHLNSLNMVVPPELGPLSRQLRGLGLSHSIITTIPDNYFSNFTRMEEVGLMNLGLTSLREAWLDDLGRLKKIYINGNPLGALPPLHLWCPLLRELYADGIGLTSVPLTLIKALRSPGKLLVANNNIIDVPQRHAFEPIGKWQTINLKGNPLHCDESMCWIKVRRRDFTIRGSFPNMDKKE